LAITTIFRLTLLLPDKTVNLVDQLSTFVFHSFEAWGAKTRKDTSRYLPAGEVPALQKHRAHVAGKK
jgi:pyruvate/oxaloacetate carboxyltransferase